MLSQLHIILTYSCNKECDHCFVYSSPEAKGTFTSKQLENVIEETKKIDSIEWLYFEGGEPFLFFPILIDAIKLAKKNGFRVGIVSNGYWATSEENALFYMKILKELKIDDLSISDDCFHINLDDEHPGPILEKVAEYLYLPYQVLELRKVDSPPSGESNDYNKGEPITGGDIRFTGRAADKLTENMPVKESSNYNKCTKEELVNPMRVHLDPYGYVHICQGITIGNMWEKPLSEIISDYDPYTHSIVSRLLKGGPLELAKHYGIHYKEQFVDGCHMCYTIRKDLRSYHPEFLQPNQIYND